MSGKNMSASREVLEYLTGNADTVITLETLCGATGLTRSQVSNAIVHLKAKYANVTIPQRGVYRWDSKPVEKVIEANAYLLKVLQRKDGGKALCVDEDSNTLYVLSPLSDW